MITNVVDDSRNRQLSRAAANLKWSFAFFALMFVLDMITAASSTTPRAGSGAIAIVRLAMLGSYVWYAFAAGGAARVVGSSAWRYIVWILFSPLLSILLAVALMLALGTAGLVLGSLVQTVVNASPLSIKFLLGGQLDSELRDATMISLH